MPDLEFSFDTPFQSKANFTGTVQALGDDAYIVTGTLTAICQLNRSECDFSNTVRFGHGATSAEYTYSEFTLDYNLKGETGIQGTFEINERGSRSPHETVDLRLGFNEGLSGQFTYGDKVTISL
ncbi:hypothetical protein N5F23_21450 [Pseudomonas sichuanensis]|uniref:hypothetical protein n=1 Tax=Pseudomonas sichuanensis TaxID=2213015 RepID=UPI00244C4F71|nr:hypothetical protein [Pseudomonas sichuanensis]MDH0732340.1 hypothetical protein [Pseudomonas sichuanensis]MDH1585156.1 hypothetical protein [Pseudomonas sichuanensis]MDH1595164.1 hypothetical protein [Pseudomonas sichuanensis]MDH1599803.1 hypothetical protein [Pseudomonas sichuanensis]